MESIVNILKEIFHIDNNTAATLTVTITVFVLGYIITGIAKSIAEFRKRKNYRQIFKEMISEIALSTKKQANNFDEFIQKLDIEYNGNFDLQTTNINFLNNFSQISFETFYNSFFKGFENICKSKKLKAFNKIFSLIDTITKYDKLYFVEIQELNTNYNKHLNA